MKQKIKRNLTYSSRCTVKGNRERKTEKEKLHIPENTAVLLCGNSKHRNCHELTVKCWVTSLNVQNHPLLFNAEDTCIVVVGGGGARCELIRRPLVGDV